MVALFRFPFGSTRSDVDGPIKRTLDGVRDGIRAVGEHEATRTWDDRYVETVSATRINKKLPMEVRLINFPDEG